jgi:hypothetical protein
MQTLVGWKMKNKLLITRCERCGSYDFNVFKQKTGLLLTVVCCNCLEVCATVKKWKTTVNHLEVKDDEI